MAGPFIIAEPDIPEGKSLNENIYLQESMATSLKLAGIEIPEHVAFQSLLQAGTG
ncbi:hypothetical protein GCM10028791_31920 [Echinicola sediminis]